MELVLAGINKIFLRSIALQSVDACNEVIAIVPYCDSDELFEIVKDANKKLTFYGRLDETVPVPSRVLKWFTRMNNSNYTCYLYRGGLHAKVIWFRGVGAYIGSANLTKNGWVSNIEAGVFIDDESLMEEGMYEHLELLIDAVVGGRIAVDQNLMTLIESLEARRKPIYTEEESIRSWFYKSFNKFPKQPSLADYKPKHVDRKSEFLKEWNATLALLRSIQQKLVTFKPDWIKGVVADGVHLDQFLHAVYYMRVGKGNSQAWFEKNRLDPESALKVEMEWWKSGDYSHGNESISIDIWAPRVAELLDKNKILLLTEVEFIELCSMVHAMREYALRAENDLLGLSSDKQTHDIKIEALGRHLYSYRSKGQKTVLQTIFYVLYGGKIDDVPDRVFEANRNPEWKIKGLGLSTLGEMVGWAMPDYYPPRNGRTSKALRALGNDVDENLN